MFFSIANIIREKINAGNPPRVLFLENVRGLKTHDKGNTLKVILATLEELGYAYSFDVLNAKYFGVPQNRERLFIIAWYKKLVNVDEFRFPYGIAEDGSTIYDKKKLKEGTLLTKVSDIFEPEKLWILNIPLVIKCGKGIKNAKNETGKTGRDLDIHYSMLIVHIRVLFLLDIGKMEAKYLLINQKRT